MKTINPTKEQIKQQLKNYGFVALGWVMFVALVIAFIALVIFFIEWILATIAVVCLLAILVICCNYIMVVLDGKEGK